jgi:hypothetical protein
LQTCLSIYDLVSPLNFQLPPLVKFTETSYLFFFASELLVPCQAPLSPNRLFTKSIVPNRLQSGHPFILTFFLQIRPSPKNGQRCNHNWYPTNHQLPTRTPLLTRTALFLIFTFRIFTQTHTLTHTKIIRDIPHSPPANPPSSTFFPALCRSRTNKFTVHLANCMHTMILRTTTLSRL